jgi:hypothetical protein
MSQIDRQAELRRWQLFGLLLIAAVILIVTLCRSDLHAIFPQGWWRFW